jgi:hypothetical protein
MLSSCFTEQYYESAERSGALSAKISIPATVLPPEDIRNRKKELRGSAS